MSQRDIEQWLNPRLLMAEEQLHAADKKPEQPLTEWFLGIDLGTCNIVSMVIDKDAKPIATRLDQADVVRDGIVWDFFGAVTIVKKQLASLQQQLGVEFTTASTSFPPGTDPRISVNVLEAAGLEVTHVIDEPSAVANMLRLKSAAVIDIGGGTTGIAVIKDSQVIYSGDEATGGHHVSLTLAGNLKLAIEQAETKKKQQGKEIWPIVRPVFEKMADIVADHLQQYPVNEIYLSGGSCALPGVDALFTQLFPNHKVILPTLPIFITPLAIAVCGMEDNHAD